MTRRGLRALGLGSVLALCWTARADDPCDVPAYLSAFTRTEVCAEARVVLEPAHAEALAKPQERLADVPAALARLRDLATADRALDPHVRSLFVATLSDALAKQPELAPVDRFALSGGTPAERCGCVYAALRMTPAPLCFRLTDTKPRDAACDAGRMQVVTFSASPEGVRAAVRHEAYLDLAWAGLNALNRDDRLAPHRALADSRRAFERYRRGYFQLPWELAFNGWLERRDALRACPGADGLGPCRVQWVLLHPLTAVGVRLKGIGDGPFSRTAVATLGVDLIGAVAYTGGFRHYLGASVALGFDNLTFEDPRLGLTLHLTKYLQVSGLAGLRASTRGDATILIGGNLVGWLHGLAD
ncbi:MAG: hypothetical protein ABW252_15180 [Polyangiales bacterium]